MEFRELNLNENLQKGIAKAGYLTCTPVQEEVLKVALDGGWKLPEPQCPRCLRSFPAAVRWRRACSLR